MRLLRAWTYVIVHMNFAQLTTTRYITMYFIWFFGPLNLSPIEPKQIKDQQNECLQEILEFAGNFPDMNETWLYRS